MTEKDVISIIRDSYTLLQALIFFEMLAKTELKDYPEEIFKKHNPEFTIDFDTGSKYTLRNDYIVRAIEISNIKGAKFGLIADLGLLQSYTNIITKTYELLNIKNAGSRRFKAYCESKLGTKYNSFYSFLSLFRNIFVHSISREYKLKENDYKIWKDRHIRKGINEIRLDLTITTKPPHAIDLILKIDDVKEGMSVFTIIGTGGMLMMIELIMNLCHEFEESI